MALPLERFIFGPAQRRRIEIEAEANIKQSKNGKIPRSFAVCVCVASKAINGFNRRVRHQPLVDGIKVNIDGVLTKRILAASRLYPNLQFGKGFFKDRAQRSGNQYFKTVLKNFFSSLVRGSSNKTRVSPDSTMRPPARKIRRSAALRAKPIS